MLLLAQHFRWAKVRRLGFISAGHKANIVSTDRFTISIRFLRWRGSSRSPVVFGFKTYINSTSESRAPPRGASSCIIVIGAMKLSVQKSPPPTFYISAAKGRALFCSVILLITLLLQEFSVTLAFSPTVLAKATNPAAIVTGKIGVATETYVIIAAILISHAPSTSKHIKITLLGPTESRWIYRLVFFAVIFITLAGFRCGVTTSAVHVACKNIT